MRFCLGVEEMFYHYSSDLSDLSSRPGRCSGSIRNGDRVIQSALLIPYTKDDE